MRAVVHDPDSAYGLRLGEVPEPRYGRHDALVEVRSIAINFLDIAFIAQRRRPGEVIGIEAAGVVLKAAEDGSGPAVGARVTGYAPGGAWAERCAFSVDQLAVVPSNVDFTAAAAVPVAGVTALRAVRSLGAVVGRRVLVTGASGGVGRMAVQLAARAGAQVTAHVGAPGRGEGLAALGAVEVILSFDHRSPFYGVLDNVGGALMASAYSLLEPNGILQSIGMASLEPTTIDFEQARLRGGGRIEAFNVFSHGGAFGRDTSFLLESLARGHLDPQIGWCGSWSRIIEAVEAFRQRIVRGKTVLTVDQQT